MSQSLAIKITLASAFFFALPWAADAMSLTYKDQSWEIEPQTTLIEKPLIRNDVDLASIAGKYITGRSFDAAGKKLDLKTTEQLKEIVGKIDRKSVSAELTIENGRATTFVPDQEGQSLDLYKLISLIPGGQLKLALPVLVSTPKTRLSELNNLGIVELVAYGVSDFKGSSKNRVTNVSVGASKFNGLIINPGDEFSFNNHLGDVDAAHGFVPEIVIKREGLFPEYGGGLCQVSSTAFRAAMNSGFPITQRKNHSFAVGYYAPQGSDATIYAPQLDMKFKNDLTSHMLIRTMVDGTKLYFEYYGTKDDRQIVLDGPYQYDKKSDGSMKAVWTKRVTKDGETIEQIFKSTYVSPNLYKKVAVVETNNQQTQQESPQPTTVTPPNAGQ